MNIVELIPNLLRSSIDGDRKTLEATTLMIIRKIRKEFPSIADELSRTLVASGTQVGGTRAIGTQPLPVDKESRYALVNVEKPIEVSEPILNSYAQQQISDFLKERTMMTQFLAAGVLPPNSILLSGPPGVGKTYIVHWLSYKLQLPLVTLDLATSISSYLGRSGQNLRSIFDYAKEQPTLLFLDELDAIAKRRDDISDLGELKRLVNVLLKEIEDYPLTGIVIGATNHPELLDKAIWRRFDRTLTIQLPEVQERKQLLHRHLDSFVDSVGPDTIDYLASETRGINAAEVCKLSEHIKRQLLIYPETPPKVIALSELYKIALLSSRDEKIQLCSRIKNEYPGMSQRDISKITNIPLATVSRYLSKTEKEKSYEQQTSDNSTR